MLPVVHHKAHNIDGPLLFRLYICTHLANTDIMKHKTLKFMIASSYS